jgi:heme/copper-type cytochrome/quinol oxidase subunit 3
VTNAERILQEPWPSLERQREAVSFGMWVFIASELLFFGGLFVSYAVYRNLYPEALTIAARETEVIYGASNTAILLTSSLTMAMAVKGAEQGFRRMTIWCLVATVTLGLAFLVVKGFEYNSDLDRGLWPGPNFALHPAPTQLFWAFYWITTGLHAVHLSIGIGIVSVVTFRLVRRLMPVRASAFEGVALYWHLVDTIWVLLLPMLYLVGRA